MILTPQQITMIGVGISGIVGIFAIRYYQKGTVASPFVSALPSSIGEAPPVGSPRQLPGDKQAGGGISDAFALVSSLLDQLNPTKATTPHPLPVTAPPPAVISPAPPQQQQNPPGQPQSNRGGGDVDNRRQQAGVPSIRHPPSPKADEHVMTPQGEG